MHDGRCTIQRKAVERDGGNRLCAAIRQQNVGKRPVIESLLGPYFVDRPIRRFGISDRQFSSGLDDAIGYRTSLEGNNDAWVTLNVESEDNELTNLAFDELAKDKGAIEAHIPDQEWDWRRNNGQRFSSISIRRDGTIDDPPARLEETREWMRDHLCRFKEIFDQRVADILKELRASSER